MANTRAEIICKSRQAFELIESSQKNIFITGKAGTGKSTLLGFFREKTKKNIVVLAPTGVAALNVRGQTIHSFFGFKPDITPVRVKRLSGKNKEKAEVYKKLDAIVIDEISMVRADLLDCVDKFMRLNGAASDLPFGGSQVVFFGDLHQLPPVVTAAEKIVFYESYSSEFFFDAKVFGEGFEMDVIELDKVFRQRDPELIQALNAIRDDSATPGHFRLLNDRCDPGFSPHPEELFIHLTTTNARASAINTGQLNRLAGTVFKINGVIKGEFEKKSLPTDIALHLKKDAQVMLLNNDPGGRWVNGSVGKIIELRKEDEVIVDVELVDGSVVEVPAFTWTLYNFRFDKNKNGVVAEEAGSFKQLPLKLAWAITIHKSQGKTFEKVIFDIERGAFAHGQTYVALSRCVDLAGLVLKKPLKQSDIIVNPKVTEFFARL